MANEVMLLRGTLASQIAMYSERMISHQKRHCGVISNSGSINVHIHERFPSTDRRRQ
jgi:hypothetical protein